MRASTVRVNAVLEPYIGAVVLGDNAPGAVRDILGRPFLEALQIVRIVLQMLEVEFVVWSAEPVRGVKLRATPLSNRSFGVRHRSSPEKAI
jgi:hypothetical protein